MIRPEQAVIIFFPLLDIYGTVVFVWGVIDHVPKSNSNSNSICNLNVKHVPVPHAVCAAFPSKHAQHATASVESLRPWSPYFTIKRGRNILGRKLPTICGRKYARRPSPARSCLICPRITRWMLSGTCALSRGAKNTSVPPTECGTIGLSLTETTIYRHWLDHQCEHCMFLIIPTSFNLSNPCKMH